jgi:flagellar hook-associated protein 2
MTGTISFGGVGSGMDTESIVTGLVSASSGSLNSLKSRATETDSAVSTLSSVSSLLSALQKSVGALADARDAASYSATSSSSAIAVSANGTAQPGAYSITVNKLAKEQRNYSTTFASSTTALAQSGTMNLKVGSGTAVDIAVNDTDTLEDIASKINASGARISASIFNDGTNYRLQVRGLDTGAANSVTFAGLDLGLPGNQVQAAQDSSVQIDGFTVKRPTNQIAGAIQGVTLALTQESPTTPVTVNVGSDNSGTQKKIQAVVDAYNAVVNKVHTAAGYGTQKAASATLSGDSALRSITQRLSDTLTSRITTGSQFTSLASLGLSSNRDGTLVLDSTKLTSALEKDAAGVTSVLAGANGGRGVMDIMSDLVKGMTAAGGTVALRSDSLTSRAKSLRDQAGREQDRLSRYGETLRKQFTAMDTTVAGNQSLLSYLTRLG